MTQTIDPIKLKASAENLEWVLKQYPDELVVQGLLEDLLSLIEDAKAGRVLEPLGRRDIPGSYNIADGVYVPYKNPSVGGAYADFVAEMRGGMTEKERQLVIRMEAYQRAISDEIKP